MDLTCFKALVLFFVGRNPVSNWYMVSRTRKSAIFHYIYLVIFGVLFGYNRELWDQTPSPTCQTWWIYPYEGHWIDHWLDESLFGWYWVSKSILAKLESKKVREKDLQMCIIFLCARLNIGPKRDSSCLGTTQRPSYRLDPWCSTWTARSKVRWRPLLAKLESKKAREKDLQICTLFLRARLNIGPKQDSSRFGTTQGPSYRLDPSWLICGARSLVRWRLLLAKKESKRTSFIPR